MLLLTVVAALFLLNNQFEPGDGTESSVSTITESQCVCLGGNVTYECILDDPVPEYGPNISSTNEPTQNPDGYVQLTNNGSSVYTSQLSFVVTAELDQQSIRCVHDNGTDESIIGNQTISIIKESDADILDTPADVRLSSATQEKLVFTWNSSLQNCPTLNFTLEAGECGSCNMSLDNITTAICQEFPIPSNCSLSIRTVVCENITSSRMSSSEKISIRVPNAPLILQSVAHYSQISHELTGLTIEFNEVEQFNVSQLIDGSASTYTILYSDSVNGTVICDSVNVSASECHSGTCFNYFNLTSSSCSTKNITVTVYGSNIFGSGIQSPPIVKAAKNSFVTVKLDKNTPSLVCIFADKFTSSQVSCIANVSSGDSCQNHLGLFNGSRNTNTSISIPLNLKRNELSYCYVVNANNGNLTLFIEGSFVNNYTDNNNAAVITGSIIGVALFLASVLSAIVLCLVLFLHFKKHKIRGVLLSFASTDDNTDVTPTSYRDKEESPDFSKQPDQQTHETVEPFERDNNSPDKKRLNNNTLVLIDLSDLQEITSTCTPYDVTEECVVVEFARKHKMSYKPTSGCGYFEFTKPEYISPDTNIILLHKDGRFFTGSRAEKLFGISEEFDDQIEINPPDLSDTDWQKVFVQTKLYNKKLLKGTQFLHNYAIFEEVNERWKIYDITKDCITADLGQEHGLIPAYKPPTGLGYFEFTQPTYVSVECRVILMDENRKLFSGNGARHFIQACENHYDDREIVHPPSLIGTPWKHVFIQTHVYNKKLFKDTKFLYFEKSLVPINEMKFQVKFYDVKESCDLASMAKKIPGYRVESGYGYYEFVKPTYISSDTEVVLMDANNSLFTGPGARDIIGISDGYDCSKPVDPPSFSSSNQWKHVFIQGRHYETNIPKGTKFLHCRSALRKVSTCRVIPVAMPQPREDCNVVDFIRENVKDSKPTLNCCYYEFTENEYIPPDAEVVLLDKDGHYFTGPGARQILEPNVKNKEELDTSKLQPPDFSSTEWQKAFIQTKSYDRKLQANTDFLYIQVFDEVEKFKLFDVTEDCSVVDFTKQKSLKIFDVTAGYGFYEFVDPEYIDLGKRIMLLDEDEKVFTGPGARQEIGLVDGTESTKIKPPDLSKSQWKHVFVQCKSYHRQLRKDTKFLYCDTFLDRVDELASTPEIFTVPKECQVFDFMTEKVSSYLPSQGKGYYEFVNPEFIAPNKQVLLISKDNKVYTGPGARNFIGADVEYNDKAEIHPPSLVGTQWKCVLIQTTSHHRVLMAGTKFYYFKNGVTLM